MWIVGLCFSDGRHRYKCFGTDEAAARRFFQSRLTANIAKCFIWDMLAEASDEPTGA